MKHKKVIGGLAVVLSVTVLLCGASLLRDAHKPTVTVQLPGNQQEGYRWDLAVSPAGAFETISTTYATEANGGGIETFVLQSQQQGDSTVTFTCTDEKSGTVDSVATYDFKTEGSSIVQSQVHAEISPELMEPWEDAA